MKLYQYVRKLLLISTLIDRHCRYKYVYSQELELNIEQAQELVIPEPAQIMSNNYV